MSDGKKLIARKAIIEDVDVIFEWANDEETRKQSFNTEKIVYESHVTWFEKKIADENCLFFIFESDSDVHEPVGCVRLDMETCGRYILSYQVAPNMRGKGYGKQMISALEGLLKKECNMKDIIIEAEVKTQNRSSCKCFEKNGYSKEEKGEINIYNKRI